jgi:hypothetical protein
MSPGFRVSGEDVFARHSIAYDGLNGFVYAFSVLDDEDRSLGWERDGAPRAAARPAVPPALRRGVFDERALRVPRTELAFPEAI